MDALDGHATIMSEKVFKSKYPKGTIPRKSEEFGKVYVCRRGLNLKTSLYTHELVWEDVRHNTAEEVHQLIDHLEKSTMSTTKRKYEKSTTQDRTFQEGFVEDDEDSDIEGTPRKRKKISSVASTPRKPRTPSKLLTPRHKR